MSFSSWMKVARTAGLAAVVSGLASASACGSDSETSNFGSGGSTGTTDGGDGQAAASGASATAGAAGGGGSSASAGAAGSAAADSGDCTPAAMIDPTTFPVCPLCTGARCVPASLVPAESVMLLADCPGTMEKCVPDEFVATAGTFLLDSCKSLLDAEGRCVSTCVPQVAAQQAFLPQATCATGERCAPCFDPRTGVATGACGLSCDTGAVEPPVTFDKCCMGIGSCVPTDVVPADLQSKLGPDTCMGTDELCAPDAFADSTFKPLECRSIGDAEGRCIPACVPDVAAQANRLPQANCPEHHLCAPCYDPLTGEDTGSCTLNGDMPKEPPVTFDACCKGLGKCVPTALVPSAQQGFLGTDTCTDTDVLCAPTDLIDTTFVPPECTSVAGAEGRCLPDCLPAVAAQASSLPQDICATNHLCAPCFDPITSIATGACTLNGDMPKDPPTTFPDCCGTIGSCVPTNLIPDVQEPLLGTDVCTDAGVLCVPDELASPMSRPAECNSVGGFEGRCLPACLPSVAARASQLPRDSCPATHLCAPCYDPITAVATGACTVNGDMPKGPPQTFPNCCNGIGSCVPPSLVPPAQQSLLGRDTCANSSDLCAPDDLANPSFQPPTCVVWPSGDGMAPDEDFEGRCLPSCLPSVAAQASRLQQGSCTTNHLCTPCWDPVTGVATGACGVNGDAPGTPANQNTFDKCCNVAVQGQVGTCVPTSFVPAGTTVPNDTCTAGHKCVPTTKAIDENAPFPTCDPSGHCIPSGSIIGAGAATTSGQCIPHCLNQSVNPDGPVPANATPGQANCQPGNDCVPCAVDQCLLGGCLLCILGQCSTGACGDMRTCP